MYSLFNNFDVIKSQFDKMKETISTRLTMLLEYLIKI